MKIHKIGFEIEGEFSNDFDLKMEDYGKMKDDGSINSCSTCDLLPREFNSPAIQYNSNGFKQIEKIFNMFIKASTNGEFHWNGSCGFHVHLSFLPSFPFVLIHDQFYKHFFECLARSFPNEWNNRKENYYCKQNKMQNHNIIKRFQSRYQAINWYDAYNAHKTIEFRMFPANEPIKMKSYLDFIIENIDHYLDRKMKLKFNKYIDMDIKTPLFDINSPGYAKWEWIGRPEDFVTSLKEPLVENYIE